MHEPDILLQWFSSKFPPCIKFGTFIQGKESLRTNSLYSNVVEMGILQTLAETYQSIEKIKGLL